MVGGVETHLDDLCNFFNKQGYTVNVRTYKAFGVKNRGVSDEERGYINIHRLWWPDFDLIFILEPYPILKFVYIFLGLFFDCLFFLTKNSREIDIIQAHGFIAALIGVSLSKLFHKRVVINTHVGFNLSKGFMTEIIKWTLLNSYKILVLTQGIKTSLIKLGIPADKIEIYHYWVNQRIFNKQNSRKRLEWENKFTVLFVGRLVEVKGVRIIFDLAKILRDINFVIVGSGPIATELRQKSLSFKNVRFVGKVDNEKLPVYYSTADILLLPSKLIEQEYEEGIPRVMIEALYCGLPVISTKSGGISDIFDKKIGVLVKNDIASIINAIKLFNQERSVLRGLKKNCRSYALKFFGINNARIIETSFK